MEEKKKKKLKRDVLDAYFQFRSPLPEDGAVQQNLTTLQIQDELEPMMLIGLDEIIEYMTEAGYGFTTLADGSVSWAVWRLLQ